jgi:hypothetical protein
MFHKNTELTRRKFVAANATALEDPRNVAFATEKPPARAQHRHPNKVCRAKVQRLLRAGLGDARAHPQPNRSRAGRVPSQLFGV